MILTMCCVWEAIQIVRGSVLSLIHIFDDATYLHIQPCDSGWDYTLYDAVSMKEMDGGQPVSYTHLRSSYG